MSKILRPILQIAAIAVNFIPGLGQLASFAITAALTIGSALLPVGGKTGQRTAAAAGLQLGEQPRQAIFGRMATAGSLVDAFNYGGKYGTDWEVLVIALADHRCDALEGFFVDDAWVPYTGDGDVPGFNGQLRAFWRNGDWGQEVPWILTDHGPGWTADDRGWNVAYAVVAYKADEEKAKNPIWTSGRPRFRFVVRGLRCYDPRKDSTAGGSGSHRRDNPATWEWSENPIVIRHNWVRGIYAGDQVNNPEMLLIGRGLSALEAPPANVFPRANLCDELVEGQARYTIGGLVASTEPFIDVESDFAAAVGGTISQPEGAVEVDPGQARAAVAHFTDEDIIVGSTVSWSKFLGQQDDGWVNTVVARFTDPEQRWNPRSAPVRRETADVIADRGPREQQPQLDFVTNLPQAQRIAEIIRRLGRLWARATVTLPPRFAFLEEGDWVTWQSDRRFGGATRTFRIEAWGSDRAWHHQLTLRQISASVFSDTDPLDDGVIAGTRTPPPVVAAPAEGAWSVSLIYYEDGGLRAPAVRIEGTVDDPAAQLVVFEFVQQLDPPDANTVWSFAGTSRPDVTRVDIPVTAGGRYWVGVAYSVDGILGDRRVLGPVDAGELTYGDGTPVQALQPAEPGATDGARLPSPGAAAGGAVGNIKDHTGRLYNPGELLNTSLEFTPSGRLQYRPIPGSDPTTIGQISLPDLGAASQIDIRRAEDDIEKLAGALTLALSEASRTSETLTDAGFYADPATGKVRIHAIEQTRERVSLAEIRLNAAEANINLKASVNYVDQQLALAVFDPSQIADLSQVFARLTEAEVDISGLNAAVSLSASATELSLVAGRVTTAESEIDALQGAITTKVDTTTFNALETRVAGAESTITALGDTASIVNQVRSVRLIEREQDANAEGDLRALLQSDRAKRDQVSAITQARQEITARVVDGLTAEATARLALQVRIGQAEATAASETAARISGQNALATQITALNVALSTETANRVAALNTANQARIDGDALIAAGLAQQATAARRADGEAAGQAEKLLQALLTNDKNRREISGALAGVRQEITAQIVENSEAVATALTALVARIRQNEASIVNEQLARVNATSSLAQSITTLNASFTTALATETAQRIVAVEDVNGLISDERDARGEAIIGEQNARQQAVQTLTAAIQSEATVRADADGALAQQINTLNVTAGSLGAAITAANQARIDGDQVLAGQITALTTTVNGNTASIATFAESINGLRARAGFRFDINGRVTGLVFNATATESDFILVSDKFLLFAPGMSVARAPFEFDAATGSLRIAGDIRIGGDAIIDGLVRAGGLTDTSFATNTASGGLPNPPAAPSEILAAPILMERPGVIILIVSFQFAYTSTGGGSWQTNISINNSVLQSGSSDRDNGATFIGAFPVASPGTYVARLRATGTNVAINPGGANLVALRTYA